MRKIYASSRDFTLVTVKKEFISLPHFIHLFLLVLQYPLKEQIHLRMFILCCIEKLFHLFLPCIGYNILQMAAFIRIPLQTPYWLCAFGNGLHSSPL